MTVYLFELLNVADGAIESTGRRFDDAVDLIAKDIYRSETIGTSFEP